MLNMSFNKPYQWLLTNIILLLALALVKPVWANGDVGSINIVRCDNENGSENKNYYKNISLESEIKSQAVPGLYLRVGDKITFDSQIEGKCFVKLIFGKCKRMVSNRETSSTEGDCSGITIEKIENQSSYEIKTVNYSSDTISEASSKKMFDWFERLFVRKNTFTGAVTKSYEESSIHTGLLSNNIQIEEGQRQLHLAWIGGNSPFTVTINGNNKKTSYERKIILDSFNYVRGKSYLIKIKGKKYEFEGKIKVVSKEEKPPTPPSELPSHLQAAWLVSQDDKWRLEAYQYVVAKNRDVVAKNPDNSKYFNAVKAVKMGLIEGILAKIPQNN